MTFGQESERLELQVVIGRRLRTIRKARRLSQATLASALGLSSLRIHRYETGASAIGAATLWRLCVRLRVDVDDIFRDLPEPGADDAWHEWFAAALAGRRPRTPTISSVSPAVPAPASPQASFPRR